MNTKLFRITKLLLICSVIFFSYCTENASQSSNDFKNSDKNYDTNYEKKIPDNPQQIYDITQNIIRKIKTNPDYINVEDNFNFLIYLYTHNKKYINAHEYYSKGIRSDIIGSFKKSKSVLSDTQIAIIENLPDTRLQFINFLFEMGSKKYSDDYLINILNKKFDNLVNKNDSLEYDDVFICVEILNKMQSKKAIPLIKKIIYKTDDHALISASFRLLSKANEKDVIPYIYNFLTSARSQYESSILGNFKYIQDEKTIDFLIDYANNKIIKQINKHDDFYNYTDLSNIIDVFQIVKDKKAIPFLYKLKNKEIIINFNRSTTSKALMDDVEKAIQEIEGK
ncbi:hypothetical protein KA977_04110 [Candidatus Dependentiae bacterium]|nr:hypothetical protein [Candidatus Dependentiae bacterium]